MPTHHFESTGLFMQDYYTSFRKAATTEQLRNAQTHAEQEANRIYIGYARIQQLAAIQLAYKKAVIEKIKEGLIEFKELPKNDHDPEQYKHYIRSLKEIAYDPSLVTLIQYTTMDLDDADDTEAFIAEFNAWLLAKGLDPAKFHLKDDSFFGVKKVFMHIPTDWHREQINEFAKARADYRQGKVNTPDNNISAAVTPTPTFQSVPSIFKRPAKRIEEDDQNTQRSSIRGPCEITLRSPKSL
jgi:hypothetical protein